MRFFASIRKAISTLFNFRMNNEKDAEIEELRERIIVLESLLQKKENIVDEAKSNFLKNIYHEIRTPLNAIMGFSDIIESHSFDINEKDNYIQYIRESSKDFLRKMDNIIEASIIEAGILEINNEPCLLYDVVSEIYTYFSLHKHISERKIAFLMNVPKELQKMQLTCDSYRITQILTNLLSNAFKFTARGVVEFGYRVVENELEFFVKDTGSGELDGKEDFVFKNFARIDNSDISIEGLGLGLSLSKNIIDSMEGRIWYNSEKSKGTTFYFTIPYRPVYVTKRKKRTENKPHIISLGRVLKRSVVL